MCNICEILNLLNTFLGINSDLIFPNFEFAHLRLKLKYETQKKCGEWRKAQDLSSLNTCWNIHFLLITAQIDSRDALLWGSSGMHVCTQSCLLNCKTASCSYLFNHLFMISPSLRSNLTCFSFSAFDLCFFESLRFSPSSSSTSVSAIAIIGLWSNWLRFLFSFSEEETGTDKAANVRTCTPNPPWPPLENYRVCCIHNKRHF